MSLWEKLEVLPFTLRVLCMFQRPRENLFTPEWI